MSNELDKLRDTLNHMRRITQLNRQIAEEERLPHQEEGEPERETQNQTGEQNQSESPSAGAS